VRLAHVPTRRRHAHTPWLRVFPTGEPRILYTATLINYFDTTGLLYAFWNTFLKSSCPVTFSGGLARGYIYLVHYFEERTDRARAFIRLIVFIYYCSYIKTNSSPENADNVLSLNLVIDDWTLNFTQTSSPV